MSIGSLALSILGLGKYADEVHSFVTAGEDGKKLFDAAAELFSSKEGEKFRDKVAAVLEVSKKEPDGSVHIGAADKKSEGPHYAKGHYEWDSMQGWVWHGDNQ